MNLPASKPKHSNNVETIDSTTPKLRGFPLHLVDVGLINKNKAMASMSSANDKHVPFIRYLVEKNILTPRVIAETASKYFGLPLFDLDAFDFEYIPQDLLDNHLIEEHLALPLFKRNKSLFVAVADPTETATQELQFHTGMNVVPIIVETDKLVKHCDELLQFRQLDQLTGFSQADLENIEITHADNDEDNDEQVDVDDAPIVQFIQKILVDSIHKGASDIHFEPYEKFYRIRFRIDGMLQEVSNSHNMFANQIAARLKVISNLDISERRLPQDGRFKINLNHRSMDFRISTCPVANGEKIVVRLLDTGNITMGIDKLGFEPDQQSLFMDNIQKPQGMVLVTGPTGSGKTVTLYTALTLLNTEEKNISTIEDPMEIHLAGINQVNINPKTGLDFATTLRSFLRQDPDIIMVGEMRDLETAEIAIKAAQTGHLVLSTLHTNSAPETITRLSDMGIASFNIASSVSIIIAQRLARRLCEHCKEATNFPKNALKEQGFEDSELDGLVIYEPKGCKQCNGGYKGRVGIYEIMPVTEALKAIIMEGGNALDIKKQAIADGMITLQRMGLNKVCQGVTSLEEVNRVVRSH